MDKIQCIFVEMDGRGQFRTLPDGEWKPFEEMPVGSMYYADWYSRKGSDGHHLIVKTPGGLWQVDQRANNCTRPEDDKHRCWVRHGTPPNITVDKNGDTCGCGHSIGQGVGYKDYHGFLTDGFLISTP